jgi:hypothetical protein
MQNPIVLALSEPLGRGAFAGRVEGKGLGSAEAFAGTDGRRGRIA